MKSRHLNTHQWLTLSASLVCLFVGMSTNQAFAQEPNESTQLLTNRLAPLESYFLKAKEIKQARKAVERLSSPMDILKISEDLKMALISEECPSQLQALLLDQGIVANHLTLENWTEILKVLRADQHIDDVIYSAVSSQVSQMIQKQKPLLVDEEGEPLENEELLPSLHLNTCEIAQNILFVREGISKHKSLQATSFLNQKVKKVNLPRQLVLYQKFNGSQILILSELYQKFTDRIAATSAEIRLGYANGTQEIIPLSPMEQYRMAQRLLHKEIQELKLSQIFSGKKVTFEDIVVASIESGVVRGADVEIVLKVDDLWNPRKTTWQKILNVVQKVGGPAMILVPPPFNQYVSMGMILLQSIGQKKNASPLEDGVSIF